MTGFAADAERLASQAEQFDGLTERVGKIQRDLSDVLDAAGSCWGADAVGQSFAGAHTGSADDTLGRLSALPDQLGSVGTRFADTAAGYRDLESGAVRRLQSTTDTTDV